MFFLCRDEAVSKVDPDIELKLAAAVQEALLAENIPACRCGKMVLENRMCREIGGDFYHFRELGQDQIALAVGDVVGHGIGAALVMTLIMGILRADRLDHRRPSRVAELINDTLLKLGDRLNLPITCTLIYGVVDLPSGLLLYVNAGQPRPLIYNRQRCATQQLPPTTMMLGVQSGVLPESCHNFGKSDRLVLFTDGITEAHNPDGQPFGCDHLAQLVVAAAAEAPEFLIEQVFAHVADFTNTAPREDDQTLVVIDFDNVSDGF